MFKSKEKETFPGGHRYKALIPTIMGLGAILYLYGDDLMMVRDIEFSQRSAWALVAAIGLVAMRDLAYMARVKILQWGNLIGGVHSVLYCFGNLHPPSRRPSSEGVPLPFSLCNVRG